MTLREQPLAVLVVDDEPRILEALEAQLGRTFEVHTATSAARAMEILVTYGPFAAVVSDLKMPGGDGVEFLVQVRRRAPTTARILLTGSLDAAAAATAVNDAGVHRLLLKPCRFGEVGAAIEATVAERRNTSVVRNSLRKLVATLDDTGAEESAAASGDAADRVDTDAVELHRPR